MLASLRHNSHTFACVWTLRVPHNEAIVPLTVPQKPRNTHSCFITFAAMEEGTASRPPPLASIIGMACRLPGNINHPSDLLQVSLQHSHSFIGVAFLPRAACTLGTAHTAFTSMHHFAIRCGALWGIDLVVTVVQTCQERTTPSAQCTRQPLRLTASACGWHSSTNTHFSQTTGQAVAKLCRNPVVCKHSCYEHVQAFSHRWCSSVHLTLFH